MTVLLKVEAEDAKINSGNEETERNHRRYLWNASVYHKPRDNVIKVCAPQHKCGSRKCMWKHSRVISAKRRDVAG